MVAVSPPWCVSEISPGLSGEGAVVLFSGAADDFCFNVSRHLRRRCTYMPDSSFHKPLQTLRDGHGTKGKIEGSFSAELSAVLEV